MKFEHIIASVTPLYEKSFICRLNLF